MKIKALQTAGSQDVSKESIAVSGDTRVDPRWNPHLTWGQNCTRHADAALLDLIMIKRATMGLWVLQGHSLRTWETYHETTGQSASISYWYSNMSCESLPLNRACLTSQARNLCCTLAQFHPVFHNHQSPYVLDSPAYNSLCPVVSPSKMSVATRFWMILKWSWVYKTWHCRATSGTRDYRRWDCEDKMADWMYISLF